MITCSYCKENHVYAKGLCRNCYTRAKRHGTPEYRTLQFGDVGEMAAELLSLKYSSVSQLARKFDVTRTAVVTNLTGETESGRAFRAERDDWAELIDGVLAYYSRGSSRLSPLQIMGMKWFRDNGATIDYLAGLYGISPSGAFRIVDGSRYADFDEYLPLFETLIQLGFTDG